MIPMVGLIYAILHVYPSPPMMSSTTRNPKIVFQKKILMRTFQPWVLDQNIIKRYEEHWKADKCACAVKMIETTFKFARDVLPMKIGM